MIVSVAPEFPTTVQANLDSQKRDTTATKRSGATRTADVVRKKALDPSVPPAGNKQSRLTTSGEILLDVSTTSKKRVTSLGQAISNDAANATVCKCEKATLMTMISSWPSRSRVCSVLRMTNPMAAIRPQNASVARTMINVRSAQRLHKNVPLRAY